VSPSAYGIDSCATAGQRTAQEMWRKGVYS
jgi:hypothetical protein